MPFNVTLLLPAYILRLVIIHSSVRVMMSAQFIMLHSRNTFNHRSMHLLLNNELIIFVMYSYRCAFDLMSDMNESVTLVTMDAQFKFSWTYDPIMFIRYEQNTVSAILWNLLSFSIKYQNWFRLMLDLLITLILKTTVN